MGDKKTGDRLAEIAQQKAEAEVTKIRREVEKLEREIQAIPAADLVARKAEAEIKKAQRDSEKLEREIAAIPTAGLVSRKAEAEIKKAERDSEKLEREGRHFWIEPVKAISGLSSILLAIVSVGTLWVSVKTMQQAALRSERDAQRAERDAVSALIRDLTADQQSLRAASARRLGAYLGEPTFASTATGALVSAVMHESVGEVQDAVLQALETAGHAATPHLLRAKSDLDSEIPLLFSNIDPTTRRFSKEDDAKIKSKQHALIKITLALAGKAHCAAAPCVPNFNNLMSLRGSQFFVYRDRLKGATFEGTALTEADFFGVDLSSASFVGALLEATDFNKATLSSVRFDRANMRFIDRPKNPLPKARFEAANFQGATFTDACLSGADFRGNNIEPAALRSAFSEGIQIEPDKLSMLGTLRSDAKCRTVHE